MNLERGGVSFSEQTLFVFFCHSFAFVVVGWCFLDIEFCKRARSYIKSLFQPVVCNRCRAVSVCYGVHFMEA